MAENVGSPDIWSDGVEKSENCRTQTLPLMLLLQRLPPHAKRHLPPKRRPPKSLLLLQRNPRQRNQLLPQRRLLLAPQRSPLLLERNSPFLLTLIPTNKKVAHSLRVGDLLHFLRGLSDEYTALFLWRIVSLVILILYVLYFLSCFFGSEYSSYNGCSCFKNRFYHNNMYLEMNKERFYTEMRKPLFS